MSDKQLIETLLKNIIGIIVEYVSALSEFFAFSLRTQEQFVLFLKLFFQSLDKDNDFLYPELACILIAIRLNDYDDVLQTNTMNILNIMIKSQDKNLLNDKEQEKLEKLEKKSNGKISRSKIDALKEKIRVGNIYAEDLFVIWREFLFNYKNATINYRFSFSLDSIKKYLELIKQLTILTTENK